MDIHDVEEAANRIAGNVIRTPVMRWPVLDELVAAEVTLKAELYQRTGAFKIRGAYNKIASLEPAARRCGIIAGSSGNHGHAVAMLADHYGIPAIVVVPWNIPQAKIAAIQRYDARIVHYDPVQQDRETIVDAMACTSGFSVVPSSDDPVVAAGHGTVALELFAQTGKLDRLVVPVGGGGLAAGSATVAKALNPDAEVIGVEPSDGDDTARSLELGRRIRIATPSTIADGLRHRIPGKFTFEVNRCLIDAIVKVTDVEIAAAMSFAWGAARLKTEPSGAAALAAVLARRPDPAGLRVGVVLSGGNITAGRFHAVIAEHRP
jgi:threonine dehydratase